jgi:hypothetical protein
MSFYELAKKRLACPLGVDISRVDKVAAEFAEGVVNFSRFVLGRSPAPVIAEGHGAKSEFRNAQAGFSEKSVVHSRHRASLTPRSIRSARCLVQEPGPPLGFIDPNFDQTRRGNIAVLVTDIVRLTQTCGQRFVVVR